MATPTFNCRKCDALVESPSGNALVVCASCGEPYPSSDVADVPVSLIPSQSSEAIAEAVKGQLSESRHMKGEAITIESVEGVYVPIVITNTTIKGMWIGHRTEQHYHDGTSGNGMDVSTSWDSGSIDETTDYPLIANISTTQFGLELIHRTLFDQQPVDLSEVDWNAVNSPILAVDIDASQLNQLLKEQILQDEKNRVL